MAKPLTPWAKALLKHGGNMKKAAEEMRMAKNRKPSRSEILGKVAGISTGRGGAVGSAAEASADIASAYFDAEARKEVARQQTHQAAVGVNQGILHELDKPFLQYTAQVGTSKKPAELNVALSVLGAYMLGVMGEKAFNDGVDMNAGVKPGQFTQHLLQIRAPLTELSAEFKLGTGAAPGDQQQTAAQAARQRIRDEAYRNTILKAFVDAFTT